MVSRALRRIDSSESFAAEVQQLLREELIVGVKGRVPKLACYAGRGPLASWIRTAALRTALNLRDPRKQTLHTDLPPDAPATHPEVRYLRDKHRDDFQRALKDALRGLSARDRNLLRLSFLDGLSIDRIGALFGVHRATAARWLGRARTRLQEATLSLLKERLKVTDSELASLILVVRSELNVSLSHLLRTNTPVVVSPSE